MRKDITINLILEGGEKINKSALARQYGCCWRTIDRRINPEKYKYEKDGLNGLESNTEKLIGGNKRISVRKVKLLKKNLNLII